MGGGGGARGEKRERKYYLVKQLSWQQDAGDGRWLRVVMNEIQDDAEWQFDILIDLGGLLFTET